MGLTWVRKKKIEITLKVIFWLLTVSAYLVTGAVGYKNFLVPKQPLSASSCRPRDNVKVIKLLGNLQPYKKDNGQDKQAETLSSDLVRDIELADKDRNIKYILLEIDSPGGNITAAEEIINTIKRANKPTIAIIRSQGLSAAFWVAVSANRVYAYPTSQIGNIGVTDSYVDYSKQDLQQGITFNQLSSRKFKDMMKSDKPLTTEERANVMDGVMQKYQIVLGSISQSRHLDKSVLLPWADGRLFTSSQALATGLIDSIGSKYDVLDYIKQQIGQEPRLCE